MRTQRLRTERWTVAGHIALSVSVAACGSDSIATGTPGPTPVPRSKLAPEAARELEALGYRKYEGTAVTSSEVPPTAGAPAKVTFDPDSGPMCMYGDPYSVWYEDRKSDDLIIMLGEGGACWSSLCSANAAVDAYVSDYARFMAFPDAPHENMGTSGPGDTNFSSWNAVFIPSCDGSVFMGDNDVEGTAGAMTRHHRGRRNLAAGLDTAVAHFPNPKRVLLAGWSAGGYGTITAMIATRLRYPAAELSVLDDSGVGIVNVAETTDVQQRLDEWKYAEIIPPSCTQCDEGKDQFAWLFSWTLDRDSDIRIGAASYYQDRTISGFLRMQGPDFEQLLRTTMQTVHDAHPDRFKRFMLPGQSHVVTTGWNHATAAGVRFDAWTVAMTNRDDSTWQDLEADCASTCCIPDQAGCEAAPECMSVSARDAPSHPDTFVGCAPKSTCTDGTFCASPAVPGSCRIFSNDCFPEGWGSLECGSSDCPTP